MKKWAGAAVLFTGSVVVALLIGEAALRLLTPFPISLTSNQRTHSQLLYVSSRLSELDEAGFRNRRGPSDQPVFVVGDSHTYGFNVSVDESWPAQLQDILGQDVYSYAVGGYGIYQYFRLFEMAMEHEPEHIVLAFYLPNDLSLGNCRVLGLEYWQGRYGELGLETSECQEYWNAESAKSERDPVFSTNRGRVKEWAKYNVALVSALDKLIWDPIRLTNATVKQGSSGEAGGSGKAAGGGGKAPSGAVKAREDEFLQASRDGYDVLVHRGRTVQWGKAMDLEVPVVQQHFQNSLGLFQLMKSRADAAGTELSFLIIPSKSRVIAGWARGGVALPVALAESVATEKALLAVYKEFFAGEGIGFVDAGDAMTGLLGSDVTSGKETYPKDNGHPWAAGYRVYAEVASELFSSGN